MGAMLTTSTCCRLNKATICIQHQTNSIRRGLSSALVGQAASNDHLDTCQAVYEEAHDLLPCCHYTCSLDPITTCTTSSKIGCISVQMQCRMIVNYSTVSCICIYSYVYMDSRPYSNDYSQAITQLTSTVPNQAISKLNYQNTRTKQHMSESRSI